MPTWKICGATAEEMPMQRNCKRKAEVVWLSLQKCIDPKEDNSTTTDTS